MDSKILVLFTLFCAGCAHDITIGSDTTGRKIYDEIRQASPAIWRQYENVTVIAPSNELIGKVVITDMRPEKDGDVEIVDGGEGKKSVTIQLKSPTVLRGYEFRIEAYSIPETVSSDDGENLSNDQVNATQDNNAETTNLSDNESSENIPSLISADDVTDQTRQARKTADEIDLTLPEENATTESIAIVSTTELDASTPQMNEDIATVSNAMDSNRQARQSGFLPTTIPSEDLNNTNESENNEGPTTELSITTTDVVTTMSDEQSPPEPTFDNSKNIPDYNSLSILDYIKSREAIKPVRRHVDTKDTISPIQTGQSETTLALDSSDIADLVPPKVDASYNTDFDTNSQTTENPVDETTNTNIPRAGRGIDVDKSIITEEYTTLAPTSTEFTTLGSEGEDNLSIGSIEDEQLRNIRDARKNPEDNESVSVSEETPQSPCVPSEEGVPCSNITDNGKLDNMAIIINLDELVKRDENNTNMYVLPIVIYINSDHNVPLLKVIVKDATNETVYKVVDPTKPSESNDDVKTTDDEQIEDTDNVTSGDYEFNQ